MGSAESDKKAHEEFLKGYGNALRQGEAELHKHVQGEVARQLKQGVANLNEFLTHPDPDYRWPATKYAFKLNGFEVERLQAKFEPIQVSLPPRDGGERS